MAKHSSDNQSARKVLRIGIVQAGKIVEERIIRKRKTVTIGSSPRNTIVVPDMPRSLNMFPIKKDRYRLRFGQHMDGRVSHAGQVLTTSELQQQGHCSASKECQELPLDEDTRGKLHLGEITVLFQFVSPPPVRPQPQLPHYIRSSFFRAVDPVLACSLVVMAVANFGFAAFLHTLDFPEETQRVEEVIPWIPIPKVPVTLSPSVMAQMGEKPIEVAQEPVKTPDKKKVVPTKTWHRPKRIVRRPSPGPTCDAACKKAKKMERLRRLVRNYALLSTIGHKSNKPGYMKDLLKNGHPGTNLDDIGPVKVATRKNTFGMDRQQNTNKPTRVAKGGELIVDGPTEVKLRRMVKDRVPTIVLNKKPIEVDSGMSHTAAYWTIKKGMACIQTGYERTLKRNPTASGKMAVCMFINQSGKVFRMTTLTDTVGDPMLKQRVKGCLGRLSFPPPKNNSARVCVPFVLKRSHH